MQKISSFQMLIAAGVLLTVIILSGCAEKIVNSNKTEGITVAIDLKSLSPGMAAAINRFTLTVGASDLATREYVMTREGNIVVTRIEVPIGRDRRFVVNASDSANLTVLYRGDTTVNILSRNTDISINLYPAVPMIYLTPHYQRILMDSAFSVDISVFHISNLSSISFEFGHNLAPAYIDTVIKNPDLGDSVYLNYGSGNMANTVYVTVGSVDRASPIVDDRGYAHLATVAFGSYADWQYDTATVSMYVRPSVVRILDIDTIPSGSVYRDDAVTELYRAPDTVQAVTWETTIGGAGSESGYSVVEAADGGFVVVGTATSAVAGTTDIYMVKTDKYGAVLWQKTFGGFADDSGFSIQATPDGYIIAGSTDSLGRSAYLVKTDLVGNAQWAKALGGEGGQSAAGSSDGGYMVTGTCTFEGANIYLVRTDPAGANIWSRCYSELGLGRGMSIAAVGGSAFTIAGGIWTADSSDNVYVIKTDTSNQQIWSRSLGGIYPDIGNYIAATTDGGSIVAGYSESFGAGLSDIYVLKFTTLGSLSWAKTYGTSGIEIGHAINPTADGGYIMVGTSGAPDVFNSDLYLIKIGSTGNLVWDRRYGIGSNAVGHDVRPTSDGGYIIAGTKSMIGAPGDIYLIKTDADGLVNPSSPAPTNPNLVCYEWK